MMGKQVIIDGATSFIGLSLISELLKQDYDVIAVIRPCSARGNLIRSLFNYEVKVVECELSEIQSLPRIVKSRGISVSPEIFYHIGWSSDFDNPRFNRLGQKDNVGYALGAMNVSREMGCDKFISIGSQAECGLVEKPINSRTPDNPITAYAEAKCETYTRCCKLSDDLRMKFYWPRLLSAYGPYDRKKTLIMNCINSCINHTHISLTSAEQIWDYVYVDDVAHALYCIAEKGIPKKKYSIASGTGRQLKEYIRIIADVFGYSNLMDGIGERPYTDNEVMYLVGDITELREDLGLEIKSDFHRRIEEMKNERYKEFC